MMRFLSIVVSTLLIAQLEISSAGAQETPAQVAQRHFDALAAQQWGSAAALVDSAYLERSRRMALGAFVSLARQYDRIRWIDAHPAHGSGALYPLTMDSALTDTALARFAQWRLPFLGTNTTIAALASIPARELLARSYSTAGLSCFEGSCRQQNPWRRIAVLGAVVENDSVAHVEFREMPDSASTGRQQPSGDSQVQVVHLFRRAGGPWRVADGPRLPLPSLSALFDERMGIQPPTDAPGTSRRPNE